jgi:hypothetical protein
MLFASTYVWLRTLLAPERLDGFYSHSAFSKLSILGRCPANLNILTPALGWTPKYKTRIFSKPVTTTLLKVSRLMHGGHTP